MSRKKNKMQRLTTGYLDEGQKRWLQIPIRRQEKIPTKNLPKERKLQASILYNVSQAKKDGFNSEAGEKTKNTWPKRENNALENRKHFLKIQGSIVSEFFHFKSTKMTW